MARWWQDQFKGLAGAGLVDEAGEGGAEGKVVDVAEGIDTELSGAVDDHQAWRSAQTVAPHGDGRSFAICVDVHADGKCDFVLVEKGLE